MKVPTQLLMLVACIISTTFTGQRQSRAQITPTIKIAPQKELIARMQERKNNDQNYNVDENLLKKFAGKSFANGDAILKKFQDILDDIEGNYEDDLHDDLRYHHKYEHDSDDDDSSGEEWIIESSDIQMERAQERVKSMQPLILELILKKDHPTLYAQLKQKSE